ncbi:MAG: tyrosine-type recombinase/integrase [Caldilineales bacterium]|nr:tyrosine-type recombinase/integrase [Caldilineales bacterium]
MATESGFRLKVIARSDEGMCPLNLATKSFLLSREAMGCTGQTLAWYRNYLGKITDYFLSEGLTNVTSIRPDHVRRLYVDLQHKGLAEQTIFNYATVLKAYCNYLVEEGMLEVSPMDKVKMPRLPRRIMPAFSPDDVAKLVDACLNNRDAAIVLCLLDSGCRAAEFVALNIGDVDVENGTVSIHRGKGKKDRVTFLGAKARKALLRCLMERTDVKPGAPLWQSHNTGERLTASGLRLMLRRLGMRAGVEHCHPHTFRRSFALWSLRAGMNVYALQQLMGHSDLTVLRRYLALVENDLREAHRKFGAIDNML